MLAAFVHELDLSAMQYLQGIAWFRFPIKGDTQNWNLETLLQVMAGKNPIAHDPIELSVRASTTEGEQNLFDIVVNNNGSEREPLPATVSLNWNQGSLDDFEVLAGFTTENTADALKTHHIQLKSLTNSLDAFLAPHDRRVIAWIRLGSITAARKEQNVRATMHN